MPSEDAQAVAIPARRLWFLGALPPPLNGQSNCNAAMRDLLSETVRVDVLPLGTGTGGKVWRACANAAVLLARARRGDIAYVSVPGQAGVWLLLPAIAALRLRGLAPWFHHHSYRAINRGPLRGIAVLVAAGGAGQRHILLSQGMRDRFTAIYPGAHGRALALSNAFLFGARGVARGRPERPPTLGLVSVLTRAKGVPHLLALFDRLLAMRPDARLVLAGPCDDPGLRDMIEAAVARHPAAISYRGLVTGAAKDAFYHDIDLFVFPTTLVDEAEPLVMLEAYANGVDVVATDTGCIADRIMAHDRLLTLDPGADVTLIDRLVADLANDWEGARAACRAHAAKLEAAAIVEGGAVIRAILHDGTYREPVSAPAGALEHETR